MVNIRIFVSLLCEKKRQKTLNLRSVYRKKSSEYTQGDRKKENAQNSVVIKTFSVEKNRRNASGKEAEKLKEFSGFAYAEKCGTFCANYKKVLSVKKSDIRNGFVLSKGVDKKQRYLLRLKICRIQYLVDMVYLQFTGIYANVKRR